MSFQGKTAQAYGAQETNKNVALVEYTEVRLEQLQAEASQALDVALEGEFHSKQSVSLLCSAKL